MYFENFRNVTKTPTFVTLLCLNSASKQQQERTETGGKVGLSQGISCSHLVLTVNRNSKI